MSVEPSWNALSKFTNLIVKPNFVAKHMKKIRVDEFVAFVKILYTHHKDILSGLDTHFAPMNLAECDKAAAEVRDLMDSLLEDMRELEKVEKSSLGLVVGTYRDSILPADSRKFFEQLGDYQVWMQKYYRLNE